jgi:hypothetical protein
MANPFAKSRPADKPYAIYRAGDITWHVLKTYKQVKNEDTYARWMVAASSAATFGSFDMGDTYALEIKRYGQLVAAEPQWLDEYDIRCGVPTPAEYLWQVANA